MFDKRVHYVEKVRSIFLQHCVVPILLMWEFTSDAKILSGPLKSSVLQDLDMKCFQMFWYLRISSANLESLSMNLWPFQPIPGNFPCHAGSWIKGNALWIRLTSIVNIHFGHFCNLQTEGFPIDKLMNIKTQTRATNTTIQIFNMFSICSIIVNASCWYHHDHPKTIMEIDNWKSNVLDILAIYFQYRLNSLNLLQSFDPKVYISTTNLKHDKFRMNWNLTMRTHGIEKEMKRIEETYLLKAS